MIEQSRAGNADVEEILHRRAAPALYVVDDACRIVLSWQAPDGMGATAGGAASLPDDLRHAVVELQCALRAGAAAPLVRLLDSAFVVRVAPLAGDLGEYFAVLVERFRSRDHRVMKNDTTRTDVLSRIIGQSAR